MTYMKRFFLSAILSLATAICVFGAGITPEEALERYLSRQGAGINSGLEKPRLQLTWEADNRPAAYIFSKGDNNGFLILSADDNTVPLLGYSDNGTFTGSRESLPDGFCYWLDCLSAEVTSGKTSSRVFVPSEREDIPPMLTTKWDQGAPYNSECPLIGGTRAYTGCVATAMAQTMKYYNYPASGKGTHSYTFGANRISFNYETEFNWASMRNEYPNSVPTLSSMAVAKLMFACGVGVDMMYMPGGSGAAFYNAVRALVENFCYDGTMRYAERKFFTEAEWERQIYDNLRNFGPVMYGGKSETIGHAFVIDGYENGYYHVNWGWSGMSDGYFLLSALNPEHQGIGGGETGYVFDQHAIFGMKPVESASPFYEQLFGYDNFTLEKTEISQGETLGFNITFYNFSSGTLDRPEIGLLINGPSESEPLFIKAFTSRILPPGYGYFDTDTEITLPDNLPDGSYTVRPAFLNVSGMNEPIPVSYPISSVGSYKMTVNGDNISFKAELPAQLHIEDYSVDTDLYISNDFKVTALLTNSSENLEFYNKMAVAVFDGNNAIAAGMEKILTLAPGETIDWEYISPLSLVADLKLDYGSEYPVYICRIGDAGEYIPLGIPVRKIIYERTVTTLQANSLKVEPLPGKRVTASAEISCLKGYYAGMLPIYVLSYDSRTPLESYEGDFIAVSANETQSGIKDTAFISYDFECPDAVEGKTYLASIFFMGNWISDDAPFTVIGSSAVGDVIDHADIAKEELYSLSGIRIAGKPETPGVYILVRTFSDGSIRRSRIIY